MFARAARDVSLIDSIWIFAAGWSMKSDAKREASCLRSYRQLPRSYLEYSHGPRQFGSSVRAGSFRSLRSRRAPARPSPARGTSLWRTHALFSPARHGRPSTFSGAGRSCRRSCRGVGSHRLERPEPSELVFEQARPGRGFFFPARSLTRRWSDGVNASACAAG